MTSVSEHNSEQEGEGGDGVNGGVHLSIQIQIILQKNVFVKYIFVMVILKMYERKKF